MDGIVVGERVRFAGILIGENNEGVKCHGLLLSVQVESWENSAYSPERDGYKPVICGKLGSHQDSQLTIVPFIRRWRGVVLWRAEATRKWRRFMTKKLQITLYLISAYLAFFGILFVFAPSAFEQIH